MTRDSDEAPPPELLEAARLICAMVNDAKDALPGLTVVAFVFLPGDMMAWKSTASSAEFIPLLVKWLLRYRQSIDAPQLH